MEKPILLQNILREKSYQKTQNYRIQCIYIIHKNLLSKILKSGKKYLKVIQTVICMYMVL